MKHSVGTVVELSKDVQTSSPLLKTELPAGSAGSAL